MINIDALFKAIDNGREGKNIGLSTGLPKLDSYIGGIQKSTYTLIFSGSGGGKSALILYSYIYRPLKDNPDKDITILYYSLELSETLLLAKLLALHVYEEYQVVLPYKQMMSWDEPLSDEYYEYIVKGREWLESISDKLIIYDKTLNRNTFYKTALEISEQNGKFVESEDGRRKIYIPNNPDKLIMGVVDHIGLCMPINGASSKEEMDTISAYAVTLRERCGWSWVFLQQENRNASAVDRTKVSRAEPEAGDLKSSGNLFNDSEICIAIYNPVILKVKNHLGYPIIVDNPNDNFIGLKDRYRSLFLLKNRLGEPNKVIPVNFFGEIGKFVELPKASDITDFLPYTYLPSKNKKKQEDVKETKDFGQKEPTTNFNFSF